MIPNGFQHFIPLGGSEGLGLHAQQLRLEIQVQKDALPLAHQIIGHHIQIFLGQPHPPQLHAGGDHNEGLAGAHIVGQQRIGRKQNPRHRVLLIGIQLDFKNFPMSFPPFQGFFSIVQHNVSNKLPSFSKLPLCKQIFSIRQAAQNKR